MTALPEGWNLRGKAPAHPITADIRSLVRIHSREASRPWNSPPERPNSRSLLPVASAPSVANPGSWSGGNTRRSTTDGAEGTEDMIAIVVVVVVVVAIAIVVAVAIPVGTTFNPDVDTDSPPAGAMNDILALFANIHYGVTRSPHHDSPSRGAWCIVAGHGAAPDGNSC